MKKLLSASRPLGVINPSVDGWFRANSITIVTYSYTTNRGKGKFKQSLTTPNLSPMGESRILSNPRLATKYPAARPKRPALVDMPAFGVAGKRYQFAS